MSAPGKSIERAHLARQLAEAQALAHIGSWEWDLVTGRVTWSDEHYRIYGLEPGTALDFDTASRCVHSADRPRIQQQIRQSLQDGMPYLCEFRVVRQDGSERVVEARGRMERASSGRPLRKVGTSQDVTERARTLARLAEAERQYRALVEHAVEGVFRTSPDGRFVMANASLARMLGYESPEQLIAERADLERHHYVSPGERSRFRELLESQGVVRGFEYEVYRRDGVRIWLRDHARVVRETDGTIFYEGTVEDITQRRRSEQLLSMRARQQAAVARLGQAAIAGHDLAGLLECAASLAADTLEVEFSQVLELRPDGDLICLTGVGWKSGVVGTTVSGGARSQAGLTLGSERPVIMDYQHRALGAEMPPHMQTHAVNSGITVIIGTPEHPFGVLGVFTSQPRSFPIDDVNFLQGVASILAAAIVRLRGEELRSHLLARAISAQEEERTRIARELHDETGQALSAVLIGLRSVHDAQSLEQVRSLTERLRDLAFNAARDVGRIARGLRPSTLDDLGLIPALRRYAEDLSATRAIEITIDGGNVDRLPRDMETTLYRIVQEALSNATRHAGAHHVQVGIARVNGTVRTTISDDGQGFDVAAALTPTRSPRTLGLVGIQERASLLGGTLTIESQVGAGARIVVNLPIEKAL